MGDVTSVMWKHQMLALNARLVRLIDCFRGILDWADSDNPILDIEHRPGYPKWAGDYDRELLKILTVEWLPAVNALIQNRLALLPDKARKLIAEDIIAMKGLSGGEQEDIMDQVEEPMELVERRLDNLLTLHLQLAEQKPYGEDWDKLRRRQEREIKSTLPKSLKEDRRLLEVFIAWRALLCEHLVNTRLAEIADKGVSTQEEILEKFSDVLKETAGSFAD